METLYAIIAIIFYIKIVQAGMGIVARPLHIFIQSFFQFHISESLITVYINALA